MLTRGQAPAVAAVRGMIVGGAPHAVLVTGPGSTGKTTLALDLAAGLLCEAPVASERPCRACRACRRVASGNHPDLHRLAPGGPGNQIKLKATVADPRSGVLDLIEELSLMAHEGGARVAIVEGAHRMNEDAQNALLKTLEEAPAGVHIVLCADDEDRLLPTLRSRCQRIRLGILTGREIETWLTDRGMADAPTAARAARLADGRPGLALAYVQAPEALAARAELDRTLLDMLGARPSARLAAMAGLLARARDLGASLAAAARPVEEPAAVASGRAPARTRGRRPAAQASVQAAVGVAGAPEATDGGATVDGGSGEGGDPPADGSGRAPRVAATERRRGALTLIDVWRRLALDLARTEAGDPGGLHDPALLEELAEAARRLPGGAMAAFLRRLDEVGRAIESNASPELAMDVLALAWPAA
jgi:DNA polymerase-3 subunit delta'